ncbi:MULTISPECIES: HNH endonuclease signature motif containing protein [unclassified Microbacterium]|uniref:HNH endonuclease signature motif containing protein n=1 Tax=unclassified Microbacterium TaxID=2609290 RepID=UPI00214CB045|nr:MULTISPECIES: HNH endonuclease signature motif containing protein [unclassified Microbacterium]MCR2808915.1 HNH endonuclease [Microbacterium sp. zg.B185]WIM18666.1 DUF222 domain-containing protein [Microbacterium sp. zg-B185]
MGFLSELQGHLDSLRAQFGQDFELGELSGLLRRADSQQALSFVATAAALNNGVENLMAVGAGVLAERSTRDLGHSGVAAVHGHSTPVALIQSITGGTKADAARAVRVGQALLEGEPTVAPASDAAETAPRSLTAGGPWHQPLRAAMLSGRITPAQHDAIRRGLGEPPLETAGASDDVVREVWSCAAEQLLTEIDGMPVEELLRRARQVRDALDPVGAEERFARRYEDRSIRRWTDQDGVHRASIIFEDEGWAWVDAIWDSALRPRRGGPRFVDSDAAAAADALMKDPRTDEQLAYDLMLDLWKAGALASASDVFGARQPGVRMVVIKDAIGPRDAFGRMVATGHFEDRGDAVPGSVIDRALCDVGAQEIIFDRQGNPLKLGREQRLYSARQRIALAVRDGGCMFPGCCVPASYCEAHHCDHWQEHEGRTDVDRGILLCRFHHMLLHNNGWRITRADLGAFVLHPPPGRGDPIALKTKSPIAWAWDPPPTERRGWRAA